jgi:hypothetical protein
LGAIIDSKSGLSIHVQSGRRSLPWRFTKVDVILERLQEQMRIKLSSLIEVRD